MRDLHEQLRSLVSQHGIGITENAEQFRAALDDYLTEQDASPGELNLLVDAVRLGGVERLVAMLDNGADPDAAVREAGGGLARDRSSDEQRSRWAVAAMGYALGRVGLDVVRQQLEGDVTRFPSGGAASAPTAFAAPQPPVQSPPHQSPAYQPPVQSPAHQQPAWPSSPSGPPGYPAPAPAYAAPRKSRAGLLAGLVGLAVAIIAAVVVVVVLSSGDDSEKGDDNGGGGGGTAAACDPCLEGDGYQYELPDGWSDITDSVLEDNPEQTTLDTASAWGKSVAEGRANVIVEVNSWAFDDLDDAQSVLKGNLSNLGGDVEDIDDRTIDGEEAAGVLLTRTNDSGVEVEQRAYIVRHGDDAVVITATNQTNDDGPLDKYEEIYDSWSWQ